MVLLCNDYLPTAQPTGRPTTCLWAQDADGTWFSLCGEAHVFTDGTPKENKYKFCPYCGRILEQVAEIMGSVEAARSSRRKAVGRELLQNMQDELHFEGERYGSSLQ